jgi:hypothetical protein
MHFVPTRNSDYSSYQVCLRTHAGHEGISSDCSYIGYNLILSSCDDSHLTLDDNNEALIFLPNIVYYYI